MLPFLEKEFLLGLSNWLNLNKNPYSNNQSQKPRSLTLRPSSCPLSALHIQNNENHSLQFSFIHPLKNITDECDRRTLRKESAQINCMFQQVELPTYIWENQAEQRFELRWEETMVDNADMRVVGTLFRQSFILSNVLSSQMDLKSVQHRTFEQLH